MHSISICISFSIYFRIPWLGSPLQKVWDGKRERVSTTCWTRECCTRSYRECWEVEGHCIRGVVPAREGSSMDSSLAYHLHGCWRRNLDLLEVLRAGVGGRHGHGMAWYGMGRGRTRFSKYYLHPNSSRTPTKYGINSAIFVLGMSSVFGIFVFGLRKHLALLTLRSSDNLKAST